MTLTMTLPYITEINKKQRHLHIRHETIIRIYIENMFEIGLYMNMTEIGRLKFKPLSSLNNPEISPIYKLDETTIPQGYPLQEQRFIIDTAVKIFEEYTNGHVKGRLNYESTNA